MYHSITLGMVAGYIAKQPPVANTIKIDSK
jgi:hypothetical protein